VRLQFWLLVMDALSSAGLFGSRLYLWAVGRAVSADPSTREES
jgi:hypothetical protein